MILQDDRNNEQKSTHTWAIVAKDKFMSGWGGAKGGASRVAWAVDNYGKIPNLLGWVSARKEMKYVNIVNLKDYRAPKGTAHFHIYIAGEGHPAFGA